ncbi:glycoside hydrolase [Delitschia confertaspora ATCC 74209]|uniref:chitinase n=1 Tax=Delitschia confertaspora ATCC 74209 TaxID=1513339 RepID=A0A9P4JAY6_9PLEO|nr:glycoside hydrolase [Delitschia confertaspora ATCC 74209]
MRWNSALIAATASVFASSATAAFNAASNTNMVMYWGQGYDQIPLEDVCNDDSIDIVVIGFINGFPKKVGDYPASNFAKDCGASYYPNPDGTGPSKLFDSCPSIGPGIKSCQNKGKKVFLSIGGGWPTDYYIPNQDVAKYFADFLWGAFGPQTAKWVADKKPRPFGDAAVDGFDLDIESYIEPAPFTSYQYANYGTLVTQLKKNVYPNGLQPLISGAPQCVIPDARLADAIKVSKFDFLFIQFYNNGAAGCGTRAGYEGLSKKTTTFTFDNWITWLRSNSNNKEVKVYIGMPAGIAAVPNDEASYLQPSEASALIKTYYNKYPTQFGGVMLWEATVSARNKICDKPYGTTIKRILNAIIRCVHHTLLNFELQFVRGIYDKVLHVYFQHTGFHVHAARYHYVFELKLLGDFQL